MLVLFLNGLSKSSRSLLRPTVYQRQINRIAVITLDQYESSDVNSKNDCETNEQYHAFLKNLFRKVGTDDLTLFIKLQIFTSVKAINDTAVSFDLTPTLLVYEAKKFFYPKHVCGLCE